MYAVCKEHRVVIKFHLVKLITFIIIQLTPQVMQEYNLNLQILEEKNLYNSINKNNKNINSFTNIIIMNEMGNKQTNSW